METQPAEPAPGAPTPPPKPRRRFDKPNFPKPTNTVLLYVAVLLIAVATVYAWQNSRLQTVKNDLAASQKQLKQQPRYDQGIDKQKYQAVFLSNGSVYFGKVEAANQRYLILTHIFYLQNGGANIQQSSSAAGNVSLVKLGCELHEPYDQMTINRDRVDFWENLQDGGQVGKAIEKFIQDNPNGQRCPAS